MWFFMALVHIQYKEYVSCVRDKHEFLPKPLILIISFPLVLSVVFNLASAVDFKQNQLPNRHPTPKHRLIESGRHFAISGLPRLRTYRNVDLAVKPFDRKKIYSKSLLSDPQTALSFLVCAP